MNLNGLVRKVFDLAVVKQTMKQVVFYGADGVQVYTVQASYSSVSSKKQNRQNDLQFSGRLAFPLEGRQAPESSWTVAINGVRFSVESVDVDAIGLVAKVVVKR